MDLRPWVLRAVGHVMQTTHCFEPNLQPSILPYVHELAKGLWPNGVVPTTKPDHCSFKRVKDGAKTECACLGCGLPDAERRTVGPVKSPIAKSHVGARPLAKGFDRTSRLASFCRSPFHVSGATPSKCVPILCAVTGPNRMLISSERPKWSGDSISGLLHTSDLSNLAYTDPHARTSSRCIVKAGVAAHWALVKWKARAPCSAE